MPATEPGDPAAAPSFSSSAERKVLAFVRDEESATALRSALGRIGDELEVRRGGLRHAIRYFQKQTAARILLVDITGEADAAAALDDLAKVCPPSMLVIVIGENRDVEFYRLLVNDLGVDEYLPKPLTRDTIQRVVLPRLEGAAAEPANVRGGQVVAVCSARGGAGATTIAVNLALELVDATKANVAVLDLHLQDGTAALMLSARLGPGLRSALEDPDRADALLLDRTAIEVAPRLRLLAAEEGFGSNTPITEAGVARVLALLRQKFNYVIIDLPIPPPQAMFGVLALARQVVVVFGPDIAALRDAKALRNLVNITTGSDRVITLLNRSDTDGGLPKALIESGLGKAPDIVIPDLGKRMLQAFNLGVPARKRVLAFRRYLAPLVQGIAGVRAKQRRWSWLKRRRR
jgi:pilus assembly protein CpaE